ncbi:MAG: L,D-transpeptidase family protein [Candidatus Omnitrophota bacterium]
MKKIHIGIIIGIVAVIIGIIAAVLPKPVKDTAKAAALEVFSAQKAQEALEAGKLNQAKKLYKKVMETTEGAGELNKIQEKIEEINMKIIFSSVKDECSDIYTVQPKDVLMKIARKFNTTVGLIQRANNLKSDIIRLKQKLKVNICPFSIVVDKSQNKLFLKRKGEIIKTYNVSTGKDNTTPVGTFKISNDKLRNPAWYRIGAVIPPDSPDNILGTRWMGLKGLDNNGIDVKGYGIHGTTKPQDLGKQITLGCVRMKNEDVEELFDIVPSGTEVTIVD